METRTKLKMRLFALCVLGVVIMCLPTTTSASGVFYNSVSSPLPGNVASQAFEATSTSQFGDHIRFTVGTSRTVVAVTVTMSSWGCESGGWSTGDCFTTPGATFTHPIRLNLYQVDMSTGTPKPGSLIATKTQDFAIPYRPSADPVKCSSAPSKWYSSADGKCYNGRAALITFDFTGGPVITVPDEIIYGIAYDTTHYGYSPIGEAALCYAEPGGCGYDSLNVGAEDSQSLVGTDVDPNGAFLDSTWSGNYCDGGSGGIGTFRLDTGCWAGYRPQIRFEADSPSMTMQLGDIALSGGSQADNFPQVWDLTRCALQITATADMNGLVDTFGGDIAHAWSELGIRDLTTTSNFNPPENKGIWLATDYEWTAGTFGPDPPSGPILDLDDKFILQKKGGQGEGAYNLPSAPEFPDKNHRFWFDRDGVDEWQAQSPLAVNGGTYNTHGIYQIMLNFSSTSATTGAGYLSINGLSQGFEVDGEWNTMELSPAGMTFVGDMKHMQVFYGLFGYGATHAAVFRDINVTGCNNPPVAKCKDVIISADLGCNATVSIYSIDNGSYDLDGEPFTLTLNHSGPYGKGNTSVTLTVTDSKGATDTCPATVTVKDTTRPAITTCPEPMVIIAGANGKAAVPDLVAKTVASDNCDLHPVITQTPAAGTLVGVGVTGVTITATDTGGNISDPCPVEVTVLAPNGVKAGILTDLRSLLQSGKVTYSGDRTKLQDAINHMTKSLEANRWSDVLHPKPGSKGESVFNEEKAAVIKLKELRDGNKSGILPAVFQAYIDRIVANDRLLAEIAIAEAKARTGNAGKIATAEAELIKGDVEAGKDHFDKAIDHYKNAWKNAIAA